MFTSLAFIGVWLFFIFRSGKLNWTLAKAAAVSVVVVGLTGAAQILPAYEYGHLAKRWVGAPEALSWNQAVPYSIVETYSLRASQLAGIVFPDSGAASNPQVGIAGLALAILAIGMCWKSYAVRTIAAVSLGALLYSLGSHSVFQGFLYGLIPDLDKGRVVTAALVVLQFGVAGLAAFGVDAAGSPTSPWPRRVMWASIVFGVLSLAIFEIAFLVNKLSFPGPDTMLLTPFVAFGLAALMFASTTAALSKRQIQVLLILLVVFELGNNNQSMFMPRSNRDGMQSLNQMRANGDIADYLKHQAGFFRSAVANDAFPENWGAFHGVEMWSGQLASVTENMLRLDFWNVPSQRLFGVKYTIANQAPAGAEEVFTGATGLKIYQHTDAFPRAWAVHKLARIKNAEEGKQIINRSVSELRQTALMLSPPPAVETCNSPDEVMLREHSPNRVAIAASMACTGMVILSDTFFPGWRAQVDGMSTPVYEVNEAMRGVVVPRGAHTVTLRYRPPSAIAGFALSFLGIAVGIALWLLPKPSTPQEEQAGRE
jgi:hypothetical protein